MSNLPPPPPPPLRGPTPVAGQPVPPPLPPFPPGYAPPRWAAVVPPSFDGEPPPASLRPAPALRRLAALLVDLLIVVGPYAVFSAFLFRGVDPEDGEAGIQAFAMALFSGMAYFLLVVVFYWGMLEGRTGRTLGKRLLRLRVVDIWGRPPGPARAMGRILVAMFVASSTCAVLHPILVVTGMPRMPHDLAAGVFVVAERPPDS